VANEKILVVDDSPTDLKLAVAPLQRKGYVIVTAADGEEALTKAAQERPTLIVLDVILPKKNGYQVCRQLKNAPETKDVKVLMVTSKSNDSDRFWGMKQGADAYLTKPYTDEDLLASVKKLLV
jgi:twitching motility two-component system response regulator PilH